ncbi:MAG: rod shape-determining protein MreB [Acidimicrobiales bacterium]
MGADLAVDFGTARTLVAVRGRGVVVDEPTVAAVDLGRNRLVAFGNRALSLRGRCSGDVAFIRPVCHGQLADLDLTWAVARELLRVVRTWSASQPTVLCCASGAATGVQRRALDRAFKQAGAGNVRFVEQQVAVALGSGLRIEEPVASMVVDVGAGTTEIGVLALGGLVTHASVPVGGGDFDEAIRRFCVRDFELVIDLETAEAVKRAIGSAWVEEDDKVEVRGRDVSNGIVRSVVITRTEVADAIAPRVDRIVHAAVSCITSAPPDLANDLLNRGLYLAGGGALLAGFGKRLASATGIPVHLVENPERCAVAGAALCMATMGYSAESVSRRRW